MLKHLFVISGMFLAMSGFASAQSLQEQRNEYSKKCDSYESDVNKVAAEYTPDKFCTMMRISDQHDVCVAGLKIIDALLKQETPIAVEAVAPAAEPAPSKQPVSDTAITEPVQRVHMWDLVKIPVLRSRPRRVKIVRHPSSRLSGTVLTLPPP